MKNVAASGWHLIIDGIVNDERTIANGHSLRSFMRDMVDVLQMQILCGPEVLQVPLNPAALTSDDDEGGITGFCVITTSHLSIHTWPLRRKFSMDVFSCKPFDAQTALDFIVSRLGVCEASITWIDRTWPAGGHANAETRIFQADGASCQPTSIAA